MRVHRKTSHLQQRRLPIGADIVADGGVHFRVWAPRRSRVEVVVRQDAAESAVTLESEGNGYFSGIAPDAAAGALYRYRLDDDPALYPDPASRFQPDGPHGPSQVIDPGRFQWSDAEWTGVPANERVLYELHAGTFTREGTWDAASRELRELRRIGITIIELMPVADFAGEFGWGYDGVDLFAPSRLYGTPDELRRFVDRAHAEGIGVILDVVYNHFGPAGCYLSAFSEDYFTDRYENEWGEPVNFDGPNAAPVRELITSNARYWVDEFHLDGLRLDATQQMFDSSPEHIVGAVVRAVRQSSGRRRTYIVCENEPQDGRLVRAPEEGGLGADALWNDDFHHAAMVALTGRNEAYYMDYTGTPQELVSAIKWGFLYQGQSYQWQKKRRGTLTFDLPPSAFTHYLQNHDQVANSAFGDRLHALTSPGCYRAMTAVLLLGPQTPMLFQGQEFAASSPFLFFADHRGDLAAAVRKGRAEFLAQFPSIAERQMQSRLSDPCARETFERCKLDLSERERHRPAYDLHRDLLSLRRTDPVFSRAQRRPVEGAVIGPDAFVMRFFGEGACDRLLLINLGRTITLPVTPEPLLAPPVDRRWHIAWSSDAPEYGGQGVVPPETDNGWVIPGQCAVVLKPAARPAE